MKKLFSLLPILVLIGFGILLVNCGTDRHSVSPSQQATANQFAFIQEAPGGTLLIQGREVRGQHRFKPHRMIQHGAGLRPWSNTIDNGTDSVYLMNNDGTGLVVVSDQGGIFESIQLSVDAKAGVFSAQTTDTNGTFYQIYLAEASGNTYNITQLTSDAEDHYQPQLSSDKKKIVFVKDITGSQAYTMAVSGGTETLVPTPEGQDVYSPTFTPDGKSIVYEDCSIDSINFVNLDGTGAAVLHNADESTMDDTPAVSPDGKLVAFLSDNDVYVMDINGQNVKQLTTDAMSDDPMFVNKKIVFLSWRDDTGTSEIYSMNPDGSGQTRLTNDSVMQWFEDWDMNYGY